MHRKISYEIWIVEMQVNHKIFSFLLVLKFIFLQITLLGHLLSILNSWRWAPKSKKIWVWKLLEKKIKLSLYECYIF